MNETLLVVEDDPSVAKGLVVGLREEGFSILRAEKGSQAIQIVRSERPQLVLLDIRLPDMSGFDVCKNIRAEGYTMPVIMVTARDAEVDRILGLEIGADDYVQKPFSLRELLSRIRAQLRRAYGSLSTGEKTKIVTFGSIKVDLERMLVSKNGTPVLLTPLEYKILICLIGHAEVPVTRQQLIDAAWDPGIYLEDEHTVDVHMRHLREKVEDYPSQPEFIRTVRGFGYRFSPKVVKS